MDLEVSSLVKRIHECPHAGVFVATGAGGTSIAWLLGVSGASETILEARVPYSKSALDRFVGKISSQHVSRIEATSMADRAYWQALKYDALERPGEIGWRPIIGVACTATITTNRPKKGEHRAHIAVRTAGSRFSYSVVYIKGRRDRLEEEDLTSRLMLNAIAAACGIDQRLDLGLESIETIEISGDAVDDLISQVTFGDAQIVTVSLEGIQDALAPSGRVIFCGSFNPLHHGHRQLMQVASEITGLAPLFEISIKNVEKPDLKLEQVEGRIAQMRWDFPVVVTRASTFVDKAVLLPNSVFLLGYDTAVRLFDERYYPPYEASDDPENTGSAYGVALMKIRRYGGSFLVAGRLEHGIYKTLSDIEPAQTFADIFTEILPDQFRVDLSSTEVRRHG